MKRFGAALMAVGGAIIAGLIVGEVAGLVIRGVHV